MPEITTMPPTATAKLAEPIRNIRLKLQECLSEGVEELKFRGKVGYECLSLGIKELRLRVSEFDRGRIVANRDCKLSLMEIGISVGGNQTTVMGICDEVIRTDVFVRIYLSAPLQAARQLTGKFDRLLSHITNRGTAHSVCNASSSVCVNHSTPFTAEWSVLSVGH
ncbi:hypothetical protein LAZ67_7001412 [Cordylochernes scorpioides]|uniref:Uncharacterized protein n=1 Tax=Cordylochernes scorpioides TaxID=51811 RepID=A0ABY6KMC5_9ARAC|nr:hypothetical protein LAZ67_7001412 [Cordylochernes scorpioides]